ncbi:MAG: pyridoxamine 5'-phosphate oxidase family protein [Halobacteriales archaeon]|nr:pyridoxamine 5'-phosphate oxidase family protein [Halobacteriales archaeon]
MTEDTYGVKMSDTEIAEFLVQRGHGVLSLGGDVPYAIPISFGYDVADHRCIFQFLFNPESKKRDYIDANDNVSLVSYEWTSPDDWRSVVIDGRLVHIDEGTPEALAASKIFAPYASTVALSVFNRPVTELDPEWYELEIDEMQGRQSPLLGDG